MYKYWFSGTGRIKYNTSILKAEKNKAIPMLFSDEIKIASKIISYAE